MLKKIKDRLDIQIICAHVNHNVRKESEEEKKFVEQFCRANDLTFEHMVIENYDLDKTVETIENYIFSKLNKK